MKYNLNVCYVLTKCFNSLKVHFLHHCPCKNYPLPHHAHQCFLNPTSVGISAIASLTPNDSGRTDDNCAVHPRAQHYY